MVKILNYWNNLPRIVLSSQSPKHIKIKIFLLFFFKLYLSAEMENIINKGNTFSLIYFKEVRLDTGMFLCEFKLQVLKSRSVLDLWKDTVSVFWEDEFVATDADQTVYGESCSAKTVSWSRESNLVIQMASIWINVPDLNREK